MQVGPWVSSSAGAAAAAAYRGAEARVPIAEAIEASFGDELHRPLRCQGPGVVEFKRAG